MGRSTPHDAPPTVTRTNRWAITAAITLTAYALIVLVVLLLWAQVGFFFPGVDYPHPTVAESLPAVVAGVTAMESPFAAGTAAALALVGVIRRGASRPPAVVMLVLAGVSLAPACYAALVGAGLVLFAI